MQISNSTHRSKGPPRFYAIVQISNSLGKFIGSPRIVAHERASRESQCAVVGGDGTAQGYSSLHDVQPLFPVHLHDYLLRVASCEGIWFGLVWIGLDWSGLMWFDLVWFDLIRLGQLWCSWICSPLKKQFLVRSHVFLPRKCWKLVFLASGLVGACSKIYTELFRKSNCIRIGLRSCFVLFCLVWFGLVWFGLVWFDLHSLFNCLFCIVLFCFVFRVYLKLELDTACSRKIQKGL